MLTTEDQKHFEEILSTLAWEDIEIEWAMFEILVNKHGTRKLIDHLDYFQDENRLNITPSPLLVHFIELLRKRYSDPMKIMAIIRLVSQKYSTKLENRK